MDEYVINEKRFYIVVYKYVSGGLKYSSKSDAMCHLDGVHHCVYFFLCP